MYFSAILNGGSPFCACQHSTVHKCLTQVVFAILQHLCLQLLSKLLWAANFKFVLSSHRGRRRLTAGVRTCEWHLAQVKRAFYEASSSFPRVGGRGKSDFGTSITFQSVGSAQTSQRTRIHKILSDFPKSAKAGQLYQKIELNLDSLVVSVEWTGLMHGYTGMSLDSSLLFQVFSSTFWRDQIWHNSVVTIEELSIFFSSHNSSPDENTFVNL